MELNQLLEKTEEKMEKAEEHLLHEFSGLRTGKASPALVEGIMVEAYGSTMRLRDVAGITTPEPRQILIQPWDLSVISAIEKSILKANLGLVPSQDGKVIRINLPEMSEERRQECVKIARKMSEESRVGVRHARREAMDLLKKSLREHLITEDDEAGQEKEVQKLTDQYVAKIDAHLKDKEAEIMTV